MTQPLFVTLRQEVDDLIQLQIHALTQQPPPDSSQSPSYGNGLRRAVQKGSHSRRVTGQIGSRLVSKPTLI